MFGTSKSSESGMGESRLGATGREVATMIARGVKLEGEFKSQGDVMIEGEVHGKLATDERLTVGPEAAIYADVSAGEAIISGAIEGNIRVEKRLEVKSTAKITGDVTAETVSIEAGAIVNGRLQIGIKAAETVTRQAANKSVRASAAASVAAAPAES